MTVRGIFYALASQGIVPKDDVHGYRPVQRQVLALRREGLLPWAFVADGTRWMRRARSYDGVDDALAEVQRLYRRDLWQSQARRIEIWLEKDALADLIWPVAEAWGVPLTVSRGVSSETFIYNAAQDALADERVTRVFTLFDFDAGGKRGHEKIVRGFEEYCDDSVLVKRLAINEAQITEWDLPTRPAKARDPEAAKWGDKPCVELDAIPPDRLTAVITEAIVSRIDPHAWNVERAVEREERAGLERLLGGWSS
jgi:hypothetical protein